MKASARELALRATDGLLGAAVNCILWSFYIFGASFGKSKTSYGAYQMFREANEAFKDFNYESFKQTVFYLRRQRLIPKAARYNEIDIAVTVLGRKRLAALLPAYEERRPWDGHVYLVSYDIAETHHRTRGLLREFLKKIGCAMLQESLWMTPYTPRKLLSEFMRAHDVRGTVLVSKLGKDGTVGEENIGSLLDRVYHLRDINDRYRAFLDQVPRIKNDPFRMAVSFQRIVSDDPQLPFPLLPKGWLGDTAYRTYKRYMKLTSRPGARNK